jgi:hypothetical protein
MRKLKLDLDDLQVESFTATPAASLEGTVGGNNVDETEPDWDEPSQANCYGNTVGTCIGPTYCCPATWKHTCAHTCINTQCGNSCITWWCNTCPLDSCNTCGGASCTDICLNCSL